MKLSELMKEIGGTADGDDSVDITAVAEPENAEKGNMAWLGEPRYADLPCHASVILVAENQTVSEQHSASVIWRHPQPHKAFALSIGLLHPDSSDHQGIHPTAVITDGAQLAEDCHIGAGAFIGKDVVLASAVIVDPGAVIHGPTTIGHGTRVHSRVIVMADSRIGSECILHPGAIIGGEGFGFVPDAAGAIRVPHRGGVVLGDRVEVGCNSTIDKGVLGNTTIGDDTKIDNLVHIAHNVSIGDHSFLAAQVGIAGSATIGNQCEFGGQSGMIGHAEIGPRVRVAVKSAILSGGAEDVTLMGIPATDAGKMRRIYAILQQLPELRDRILRLEQLRGNEKS